MAETLTLALAGNPNCGKTTMFNALTGAHQHVGNWPGVTVEKKHGLARAKDLQVRVVDLPGTYSLTAYTQEEIIARRFVIDERPQAVIDVMNADVLERNLYLAVQIMELGAPLVLCLNMMDEVRKNGKEIDSLLLAELTGCPAVECVARQGLGVDQLLSTAVAHARAVKGAWSPLVISYGPDLDPVLAEMEALIRLEGFMTDRLPARWTGIKYLEGDEEVIRQGRQASARTSADLEAMCAKVAEHLEKTLKATPDAIIADFRYGFIAGIAKKVVLTRKDKANRLSASDQMDKVLTHRVLGPAIMAGVVYFIYKATFSLGETPMGWMQDLFGLLAEAARAALAPGLLRSLVVSGVIDGVGGILGFVPLILIMFLMISALEDSGYLARMAYMLDRVFRIFGLHGNSVLPFIISGGIAGGCAVPGVMAARTLRSPREKLATLLVAPFMTCGAKIPVFLMLAAAFFPGSGAMVMFAVTICSWAAALLVARLLRWTVIRGESTPFVMELPPYRMPTLRGVLIHTWERTWEYVKKAGTVILGISILLWAAMTFPTLPPDQADRFEARAQTLAAAGQDPQDTARALADLESQRAEAALRLSFAGRIGRGLEPLTGLAGFDWRANIALVGGVAAKEVIVSTLATAYSLGGTDADQDESLAARIKADPGFSKASAVAMILFVMLYAPCCVTLVTMARESSWRWALFAATFNTALAFAAALAAYQAWRLVA